ncbi:uncharacterized protein PG998_006562 [Apiospora kogelbergensis]|uniref:uncharacterized protein n=1 Tax=Apiospora kogelbergensis TaxID=1337665 RepID=UPI003132048A
MSPIITLPGLALWGQQLASLIPLAALLEFVDLQQKLHVFELSGFNPPWSWALTPEGAKLILSDEDSSDACCLDRPARAPMLHCMDCKFGNFYPCSAPTTTRYYLKHTTPRIKLSNHWPNGLSPRARKHRLELVVVRRSPPTGKKTNVILRALKGCISTSLRLTLAIGWALWLGLLCFSVLSGLYVAAAYLVIIPVTGVAVHFRVVGEARQLLATDEPGEIDRQVVATNSVNGTDWYAFYGPSDTVNALLNRPLLRAGRPAHPRIAAWIIRGCAASQWGLIVASCVMQGWDAFAVTSWITFCALVGTYIYPPEQAVQDWLSMVCRVDLVTIKATFSSRRAMLAALVHLNPDQENTEWLDPILSKTHQERKDWEAAVLSYSKSQPAQVSERDYWYKFVREGVSMGG